MKLADKWTESVAVSVASTDLHDEAEEHDEVDEAEDGCGGVLWQPYVLKSRGTRYKMRLELARAIRGIEEARGKQLSVAQYKAIFEKWKTESEPYLKPGPDYWTEFLALLDYVIVPKGDNLRAALERAKGERPPPELQGYPNDAVQLFGSLCRERHRMSGGNKIMIDQKSFGLLFNRTWQTIGNWIKALKTLGVLKLAEPAIKRRKSARYFYTASDAAESLIDATTIRNESATFAKSGN